MASCENVVTQLQCNWDLILARHSGRNIYISHVGKNPFPLCGVPFPWSNPLLAITRFHGGHSLQLRFLMHRMKGMPCWFNPPPRGTAWHRKGQAPKVGIWGPSNYDNRSTYNWCTPKYPNFHPGCSNKTVATRKARRKCRTIAGKCHRGLAAPVTELGGSATISTWISQKGVYVCI